MHHPFNIALTDHFPFASHYQSWLKSRYRNALGAGLFILFKDAGSLLFKYLELRQRGRERVKDLPFDQGLIAGLDLREGVVDRDSSR